MRTRLLFSAFLVVSLLSSASGASEPIREYGYQIVDQRPHDTDLFTQGLILTEEQFYESGGRYGQSRLVRYRAKETRANLEKKLDDRLFAEGLTLLDGTLYLLTWKAQQLLVLDAESLQLKRTLAYAGEGWGLTHNGEQLIRSDGSSRLHFHNTEDFGLERSLTVTESGKPIKRLNELEYIQGYIWANIWHSDKLVKINPQSGQVLAQLDLRGLAARHRPSGVLNGIAYDQARNGLWVTGKNWPILYLLKLEPELQ